MLFAFAGAAGNAILFVVSLVLWAVLLAYTVLYAARCYLVTFQGTVAGHDKVPWPDDPVLDWLTQALSLVGLLSIWLVPVGFLSRALAPHWLPGQGVLRVFLLAVPVLWLFFPYGLLSSMVSGSRWQVVSGQVLTKFLKMTPTMIGFYAVTGVLGAGVSAVIYLGLFSTLWYALPFAAALAAAGLLIHARLLGRVGWLMQRQRAPKRERGKSRPKQKPRKRPRPVAVNDPWAVPEDVDEEEVIPVEPGYGVVEVAETKPPRPSYLDPEPDPYTLAEVPAEDRAAPPAPKLELSQAQVEREIELRTRRLPNPPPEYPMLSGVYGFPFYLSNTKALVALTVWGAATGGAWRLVSRMFPF